MTADRPPAAPAAGSGTAHPADAGQPDRPPGALARFVAVGRAVLAWWGRTRVARANSRFGAVGGGVLAGGIAYATLFSVVAGLTLAVTVFMAVLGGNQALREAMVAAVAAALPGLIATEDGQGLIDPGSLRLTVGFTVTGVVAVVTLLFSAMAAVGAVQTAMRAVFGIRPQGELVVGRLRQLAGFAGMALAVLVAAVLSLSLSSAAGWALALLGWSRLAGVAVGVVGVLVSFVVDAAVFVLLVTVLTKARPPRRDLLWGAAISATGVGVVRLLGTSVVAGSATRNPVLASFAAVVVLLVWVNLAARIVLLAAAWTADPPEVGEPAAPAGPAED
jgi:membrane protein